MVKIQKMFDMSRVFVAGDSWSSALEEDTKLTRGWPYFLGVPEQNRFGVSGSTAKEWAENKNNMMSLLTSNLRNGDVCILSLVGNDFRHAAEDGDVSPKEIVDSMRYFRECIKTITGLGSKVICILYADPYFGLSEQSKVAVPMINMACRASCLMLPVEFFESSHILTREHFDGVGFHANSNGHKALASGLNTFLLCQQFK